MFEDCSIMIIKEGTNELEIFRLEVDAKTQAAICKSFATATQKLIAEKTKVNFDGNYKPNDDEFLAIEKFKLPDTIMDAIRNPLGVTAFIKKEKENEENKFPEIKAIFIGERIQNGETEKFNVAFQCFRKEQYIRTNNFNLFFEKNTFFQEKRFGISVFDNIDCFYTLGELLFSSYYFARQIFDLSDYYRLATDNEVEMFATNGKLLLEDTENFKNMANTWIRRRIASINDSKVLSYYTAIKIKKLADETGIDIDIKDETIVIPNDKKRVKAILGFLDEAVYKGLFSQKTYFTNSKHQIK